jgi:hypothetical protein
MISDYWRKYEEIRQRRIQEGMRNLQKLYIPDADGEDMPLEDFSCIGQDEQVAVYFRNLEKRLIEYIEGADVVLGCVAWLTSEPILTALAHCKHVSLIVQKEDFLRPDIASRPKWAHHLRQLYDRLPQGLYRGNIARTTLEYMSSCGDPTLHPIRCVGNYNAAKESAFPRSHHKFVLFCRFLRDYAYDPRDGEIIIDGGELFTEPYAVWTGSFNFTKTAGMSFENALVLRDPKIIQAFYQEYAQVAALSEPLDWETAWSEPEWRIGT